MDDSLVWGGRPLVEGPGRSTQGTGPNRVPRRENEDPFTVKVSRVVGTQFKKLNVSLRVKFVLLYLVLKGVRSSEGQRLRQTKVVVVMDGPRTPVNCNIQDQIVRENVSGLLNVRCFFFFF